MVVLTSSAVIGCTPDDAFDCFTEDRSELVWNPAFLEKYNMGFIRRALERRVQPGTS